MQLAAKRPCAQRCNVQNTIPQPLCVQVTHSSGLTPPCRQKPRSGAVPGQQAASSSSSSSSSIRRVRHQIGSSLIVCQAGADAAAPLPDNKPDAKLMTTLGLGALFAGWYIANVYFNIFYKTALKVYPYPLTVTTINFFIGMCLSAIFWITGAVKRPQLDWKLISTIYPLAMVHVLGNVFTNVSLGKVAVSFTHTVKAMEPLFSVILSALFLGDTPQLPVLITLMPIVGGVIMASMSEATFNWTGFLAAMLSNVTFQSRNVLSKKLMISKGALDNVNLFQIITILALFISLPVSIMVDGLPLLPENLVTLGLDAAAQQQLFWRLLSSGICFHSYQQLSYMILARVSPVTHSIGNCVKRVVVILASVVAFQHPMSTQNVLGTGLAMVGVLLYSQAKRRYKSKV